MSRPKNPNAKKTPVKMTREDQFLYDCVREEARDPGAIGRALTFKVEGVLIVDEPPAELRRKKRLATIAAARKKVFPRQAYLDGVASYDPYSGELNCV